MRSRKWFYFVVWLMPLLVLVIVPSLRVPLSVGLSSPYPSLGSSAFIDLSWHRGSEGPDYLKISNLSLDDYIWALSRETYPSRFKKLYRPGMERDLHKMLSYAKLSKEYPRNALVLAQALKFAPVDDGRVAGPWEDIWDRTTIASVFRASPVLPPAPFYTPASDEAVDAPIQPPSATPPLSAGTSNPFLVSTSAFTLRPKSPMTPDEIALGLDLAEQGRLLEPENTYFDWMKARFLFAARRDAEATQLLISASRKKGFDAHNTGWWGAGIRSLSSQNPLLAEQKWELKGWLYSNEYKILKHVSNMALWTAMQRQEAGDVAGSLEIQGALMRLHPLRLQNNNDPNSDPASSYDLLQVWGAPTYITQSRALNTTARLRYFTASVKTAKNRLNQFSAYATTNGRSDLSNEAAAILPKIKAYWAHREPSFSFGNLSSLFAGEESMVSIHLSWFAFFLALGLGAVSAALWIFFSILGPLRAPAGATTSRFGPRIVFYPVIIGGAAALLLGVASLWALCLDLLDLTDATANTVLSTMAVTAPALLSAACCLFATIWSIKKFPRPEPTAKKRLSLHELMQLSPWRRMATIFWWVQNPLWFRLLPIMVLFFFQFSALALMGLHIPRGILGGFDIYFPSLMINLGDIDNMAAGFIITSVLYLLASIVRWRFDMPQHLRPTIYAGFFAFRRALLWTIPLALWFIIAALTVGNGPRAQLDSKISNAISIESAT
jgi:hypothetical protein